MRNKSFGLLLAILSSTSIAFPIAFAQRPVGLTDAEAQALEDRVNKTVRESGILESANSVELRSPLTSTVRFLIPRGTIVQRGDRVASLESADLDDRITEQKTQLANREAELQKAKSDLRNQQTMLEDAKLIGAKQVRLAMMRLELFTGEEGEYATQKKDLEGKRKAIQRTIEATSTALAEATERFKLGDGSAAMARQFETALVTAQEDLAALERQQKLLELESEIRIAELELERLEQEINLKTTRNELETLVQQAEAQLQVAQLAMHSMQSKLDSLVTKAKQSEVVAPIDGVVLYPVQRRGAAAIEPGASVREGQVLLEIADMEELQVAVTVNETRIGRVKVGQKAEIRVDALVNRSFTGTVKQISHTPEPASFLQESGNQYRVIVSVQEPLPVFRIGMTAMVDIRTDQ